MHFLSCYTCYVYFMYNLVASNIATYSDSSHLCLLPTVPLHLSCRLIGATTVVYISLAAGTKPYIEV
jgi:hypothetical protein